MYQIFLYTSLFLDLDNNCLRYILYWKQKLYVIYEQITLLGQYKNMIENKDKIFIFCLKSLHR